MIVTLSKADLLLQIHYGNVHRLSDGTVHVDIHHDATGELASLAAAELVEQCDGRWELTDAGRDELRRTGERVTAPYSWYPDNSTGEEAWSINLHRVDLLKLVRDGRDWPENAGGTSLQVSWPVTQQTTDLVGEGLVGLEPYEVWLTGRGEHALYLIGVGV